MFQALNLKAPVRTRLSLAFDFDLKLWIKDGDSRLDIERFANLPFLKHRSESVKSVLPHFAPSRCAQVPTQIGIFNFPRRITPICVFHKFRLPYICSKYYLPSKTYPGPSFQRSCTLAIFLFKFNKIYSSIQ